MITLSPQDLVFDTRIDTTKIYVSMNTNFKLRTSKKELQALYLHISGNGKRERIHLDIYIPKSYWCEKKQRIDLKKISDELLLKKMQDTNLIIDNVDAKITNIKTVYRLSEQVLSPEKLKKELIENLPRVKFCTFFQKSLDQEKSRLEPGTFRKLQAVLNKIKAYDEAVIFTELTLNWFDNYKKYLYSIGNKTTTINSNIKSIKKFLRIALKSGIKIPCNIDDIKAGSTLGVRVALEPYELKKLKQLYNSDFINESHRLIIGYFLFSCVTGLRFSDIMNVNREAVSDDFIQFKAQKVQKLQTISLNKTAKEIINFNEKLFVTKFTNEYINRELKVIMRNVGIKKKVSFHVARHTFATSFLRAGGKIEKLQLLLGHSDLRQSMIYNHIVASEANKEIHLLDNLF
ncbi:site-specific integrase [Tenacibaculum soleae]|uniref:site-specific integrase n=1 Tax=Tenacibaculum soleae TaxID=447689 RepID=UPI0022FFE97C|nr:site-specific integrase [Tenacibaculum soleae]